MRNLAERATLTLMPAMHLIDSHCHLDFEIFDLDRNAVMQRAQENHISDIVIPGTERIHWDRITELCTQYRQLHPCYGLHPYWINSHERQDIKQLESYIEINRPVAIGECGLDFRPQQADKKMQLEFFEAQLSIAEKTHLPVVIHSVKATETVIACIKKFKNLKGVIHSYSGSSEQARQLIELNFYISISGSVTYDNANKLKKVVKQMPLTSLLLETDAPDQPDRLHLQQRNEPAYMTNTLDAISEIRQESRQSIAMQSSKNARVLFAI